MLIIRKRKTDIQRFPLEKRRWKKTRGFPKCFSNFCNIYFRAIFHVVEASDKTILLNTFEKNGICFILVLKIWMFWVLVQGVLVFGVQSFELSDSWVLVFESLVPVLDYAYPVSTAKLQVKQSSKFFFFVFLQ